MNFFKNRKEVDVCYVSSFTCGRGKNCVLSLPFFWLLCLGHLAPLGLSSLLMMDPGLAHYGVPARL